MSAAPLTPGTLNMVLGGPYLLHLYTPFLFRWDWTGHAGSAEKSLVAASVCHRFAEAM